MLMYYLILMQKYSKFDKTIAHLWLVIMLTKDMENLSYF